MRTEDYIIRFKKRLHLLASKTGAFIILRFKGKELVVRYQFRMGWLSNHKLRGDQYQLDLDFKDPNLLSYVRAARLGNK